MNPEETPYQEYMRHLRGAHIDAQLALNMLYEKDGPRRGFWYRWCLGRAQSILISLYVKESNRKES